MALHDEHNIQTVPTSTIKHTGRQEEHHLVNRRTDSLHNGISTKTSGASISRTPSRNLLRAATMMMIPEKRVGPAPSVLASLRSILFASCMCAFSGPAVGLADPWSLIGLNVFLVFIPVSVRIQGFLRFDSVLIIIHQWALNFAMKDEHTLIFVCELTP